MPRPFASLALRSQLAIWVSSACVSYGSAAGAPDDCDLAVDPRDSSACLGDDATNVYVSPYGDDAAGRGTREAPLRTIAAAVSTGRSRIFLCGARFDERVILEGDRLLGLYGGFTCTSWEASGAPTRIESEGAPALRAVGVRALALQDVVLLGKPGHGAWSAVGAAFVDVRALRLARVTIAASSGGGPPPSPAAEGGRPGAPAAPNGDARVGGVGGAVTCAGSVSTGGKGGAPGQAGGEGAPTMASSGRGGGGQPRCGNGSNGADGATGAAGTVAAPPFTLEDDAGFATTAGGAGSPGSVGQGGGGGGGSLLGGSGGGGGAGGCPGAGGAGGLGGGSSVGLVLVRTTVAEARSTVVRAADGATGALGGAGGAGGAGGVGWQGAGCAGAPGGRGGAGGSGGPGAGGSSIGVLYRGPVPTLLSDVACGSAARGGGDAAAGVSRTMLGVE